MVNAIILNFAIPLDYGIYFMCGITGILHFDNKPVDQSVVIKMAEKLVHRGPDDSGFYINNNIGLGHRRLSIIDLSTGHQPMISDDNNVVIVFNGEIYNYIELREELKKAGHRFRTASDTEVILNSYKEWGKDCLGKINGMWAFAIWDEYKKELFLSRDRVGEKPLYYTIYNNTFLFASEIKSLFAYGVPACPELEMLEIYLSLSYIPAPFTFYKGIKELLPGQNLVVKDNNVSEKTYWDLPEIDEQNMLTNKQEIYEQFDYLLKDSVKIRMRSDVPYGAFLSGGLDSSGIVSIMSGISNYPVETFTMGFTHKAYDESRLARKVAEKFNTSHHEQIIKQDTFENSLDKVVYHYDQPFGDSSAIPTGYISEYARQKVKMVLTGDGGDEVLSGYSIYQGEKFAGLYQRFPLLFRTLLEDVLIASSGFFNGSLRYKLNRVNNILAFSNRTFDKKVIERASDITINTIRSLLNRSTNTVSIEDYMSGFFSNCSYKDNFYKLMYFHFKLSLPNDMLVKVDRMSMAHSLETRLPFLDYRLIEFMAKVHKNIKLDGFERKSVLRNTIGKKLPVELLRAPKRGFEVPLREWFKENSFTEHLDNLYRYNNIGMNSDVLKTIVGDNLQGKKDFGNFIWMLFVLNKCLEKTGKEKRILTD